MKDIKRISIVVIMYFLGMFIGWTLKPSSVTKTEFKTITKNVSICSDAKSDAERQICFAQDACHDQLEDFTYDSLRIKTDFNCKK